MNNKVHPNKDSVVELKSLKTTVRRGGKKKVAGLLTATPVVHLLESPKADGVHNRPFRNPFGTRRRASSIF